MGMSKKERAIREKRTLEATKKDLMGPAGKLGIIARFLGKPIIRQGSGLFDSTYLDDPYELPSEDKILTAEDTEIQEEGYVFDGLSRGIHIEIKLYSVEGRLMVDYKGYSVYSEASGDLRGYTPLAEWENIVDRLYENAKERRNKLELDMEPFIEQMVLRKRESWMDKMRRRWGI